MPKVSKRRHSNPPHENCPLISLSHFWCTSICCPHIFAFAATHLLVITRSANGRRRTRFLGSARESRAATAAGAFQIARRSVPPKVATAHVTASD